MPPPTKRRKTKTHADGTESTTLPPIARDLIDERLWDFRQLGFSTAKSFINRYSLAGHHPESMTFLMQDQLPRVIAEEPIITHHRGRGICVRVDFVNTYLERAYVLEDGGTLRPCQTMETHARRISLTGAVRVDARSRKYHADPDNPDVLHLCEDMMFRGVEIFQLPLMDGTAATHDFDQPNFVHLERNRGTFVMNGHRKVLRVQNNPRICFPFVTLDTKTGAANCEIRSLDPSKIRSSSTVTMRMTREKMGGASKVQVNIPYVKKALPLTVFLRLLGVRTLEEMLDYVCGQNCDRQFVIFIRNILCNCRGVKDQQCRALEASTDDLFVWVAEECGGEQATGATSTFGKRTRSAHISSMMSLWSNEVFPHLEMEGDPEATLQRKASFCGRAIRQTARVLLNLSPPDKKDEPRHRRFFTAGHTLAIKIRQIFRRYCNSVSSSFMNSIENSQDPYVLWVLQDASSAFARLRSCMSTGNFSVNQKKNSTQAGVSQVLNSTNKHSRLADLTSVNTPVSRKGNQTAPRALDPASNGILDPTHTPDSRNAGLVNHHTVCARFSLGCNENLITSILQYETLVLPRSTSSVLAPTLVIVNGALAARTYDGHALTARLDEMRRLLQIAPEISVRYDEELDQVTIGADQGTAMRPVFVRERLDVAHRLCERFTGAQIYRLFPELLVQGAIKFMDKEEERTSRIALSLPQIHTEEMEDDPEPFTHLEIHPEVALFSTVSGCIPNANHNSGPRLVYGAGMAKQAIAAQHPTFVHQLDPHSTMLMYPQNMVETDVSKLIRMDLEPDSQMFVVAVGSSYDGLTQEDAVFVNRDSCQRGLGSSMIYWTSKDMEKIFDNAEETFCNPLLFEGTVRCLKSKNYNCICPESGLPLVGALIQPLQPLIGKVIVHTTTFRDRNGQVTTTTSATDSSMLFTGSKPARIEKVVVTSQGHGKGRLIFVRTVAKHDLEVGDKIATDEAHKGVIAAVVPGVDMPRTMEGIIPDIFISVMGYPSRMCYGSLITTLQSKLDTLRGRKTDATSFRGLQINAILEDLADIKPSDGGMEFMASGRSGAPIGTCFMGLTKIRILRHQVNSKIHARARGPVSSATRQPGEGKQKSGGLRCGEMERQDLSGLGCAELTRSMMKDTDMYAFHVCTSPGCHQIATPARPEWAQAFSTDKRNQPECPRCHTTTNLAPVSMAYCSQLLKKHLASANIDLQFIPEEDYTLDENGLPY